MTQNPEPGTPAPRSPLGALALAWGFVSLPLAWGVFQTVMTSIPLFHGR